MRIYLLSALRLANAEILPHDWAATCDEFLETIDAYQAASEGLADLSTARDATMALKAELDGLAGVEAGPRNACLMELARILLPINTTRAPRFRHDPAYTVPKLPTLAVAAELPGFEPGHMRRVASVELMRGMNRFCAAIEQARRLVAAAR